MNQLTRCQGILSRGLQAPRILGRHGVQRTDAGMLGAGIYFAADARTSAMYTVWSLAWFHLSPFALGAYLPQLAPAACSQCVTLF
jgi:hypothetical protein